MNQWVLKNIVIVNMENFLKENGIISIQTISEPGISGISLVIKFTDGERVQENRSYEC